MFMASVVCLGFVFSAYAQETKPRIAIIPTCEASSPYELFQAKKELAEVMDVDIMSAGLGVLPSAEGVDLSRYNAVFIVANAQETIKLKEAVDEAKKKTSVIVFAPVVLEGNIDLSQHPYIEQYWGNSSRENFKRLMVYLGVKFGGLDLTVEAPVIFPDAALYHPDAKGLFAKTEDYLDWYTTNTTHRYDPNALTVGFLFHKTDYTKKRLEVIDALIRSTEEKGCNAIALYSRDGHSVAEFFKETAASPIDVMVSLKDQLDWSDHERGIEEAHRVNVPILYAPVHYYQTSAEWEKESSGLGEGMSAQLAYSEMNGMFEPIVIAGKRMDSDGKDHKEPIHYQINWRVDRAISWARLHRMKNADKKIAIPYYSEGGGKGNIGADIDYYLDAQGSLVNILKEMSFRGYNLGSHPIFDKETISKIMAETGSNIGVWNKQEIRKRVSEKSVVLIPEEKYLSWFNELDPEKKKEVVKKWGTPPGNIMTYEEEGKKFIVIPKIELGNILLLPHPTWGFLQDKDVLYSSGAIPPHHQYIAFWYWLNREYKADAVISIFTQISLMPGKQSGLSRQDWGGLLMQNVPNIHPFPIQAGGGIHNKRRANALVIDYMPTVVSSELYEELLGLKEKIALYEDSHESALKASYAKGIVEEVKRLKIDKELKGNIDSLEIGALIKELDEYLDEIKKEHMPYGSHTLSEAPQGDALTDMIFSMLGSDFKKRIKNAGIDEKSAKEMIRDVLSGKTKQGNVQGQIAEYLKLAVDYAERIAGCKDEVPQILNALEGRYILPGPMDDPIRNPDALPTGRNPQGLDARAFPTEEAWETGKKLADEMLNQHRKEKGEYPRKVAFVLWSSETTKNHGVLEAQIFYLLGVKPVWSKGRVKDIELIDSSKLRHPRVDVVITASGLYRDHFQEKIKLFDRAVQLVSKQNEKDNFVRDNTYFIEKELIRAGYSKADAESMSTARVFSEALGAYSPSIQFAIPAGDTWKNEKDINALYMSRVSHMYGEHANGKAAKDVFTHNLQNVDAAVFSRSSNVYGILEHPMVAAYFGGLKMAVRNTSGKDIGMYITNLRDAGNAKVETLERFYNRELRSRYFNPKWIKGMMEHGYDGARYMDSFTENMWVWDVTTPNMVTEDNWNEVYDVYVKDKHNLQIKEYFDKNNPYALQGIISTMFEVKDKGYWHPSKEVFEELVKVYAESVAAHGISGAYGSTDEAMHKDVTEVLKNIQDLPPKLLEDYQKQIRQFNGKLEQVKGYEVKEVKNEKVDEEKLRPQLGFFVLLVAIGLIGLGWWRGNKER